MSADPRTAEMLEREAKEMLSLNGPHDTDELNILWATLIVDKVTLACAKREEKIREHARYQSEISHRLGLE